MYGFDSMERIRDRFGPNFQHGYYQNTQVNLDQMRNIRVIERQYKKIAKQNHFVDPESGAMRPVPEGWDSEKIGLVMKTYGLNVVPKMHKRIRWTTTADNVVLHDDWSPYKHFTIVPFFPFFRRGKTVGLVENLIGPQELLNKVSSQELHVINTTANSGWKVRAGALKNMSMEELEERGAETGLVLVLDDIATGADKIVPNQTPTGLDRISYKAEEHIKTISGVSDYQTGSAREDVSAKAVQENLKRGSVNQAKPIDSLARSDYLLARHVLSMVQEYYAEPRIVTITNNRVTGEQSQVAVNQPTPEGTISNDLTVGEYEIVVTSTPHRATLEQSQFEQCVSLREQGVPIPDEVLIEHSSLYRKNDILKKLQDQANSADAQHAQEVQKLGAELELANLKAESARVEADAVLKQAKARKESGAAAIALRDASQGDGEQQKMQMEMEQLQQENAITLQEMQAKLEMAREELDFKRQELELKRQEAELKLRAASQQASLKAHTTQHEAGMKMSVAAQTAKMKVDHTKQLQQVKIQQEKRNAPRSRS